MLSGSGPPPNTPLPPPALTASAGSVMEGDPVHLLAGPGAVVAGAGAAAAAVVGGAVVPDAAAVVGAAVVGATLVVVVAAAASEETVVDVVPAAGAPPRSLASNTMSTTRSAAIRPPRNANQAKDRLLTSITSRWTPYRTMTSRMRTIHQSIRKATELGRIPGALGTSGLSHK